MISNYILLTIMIFLWSLNFIVVDFAVEFIPPLSISLYRMLIASISFLIIDSYFKLSNKKDNTEQAKQENEKFTRKDWILIIAASLIGQSFYFYALYGAVSLIGPSLPALFVCLLSPVIMAIFALFLFNEKLNKMKILGFAIASMGGFLLVTGGDLSKLAPSSPNFLGFLLALILPVQWSIYSSMTKKISKTNTVFNMLKMVCYLATIELFLLVIFLGEFEVFLNNFLNPVVILTAIYIGFVCHVVGYFIWQKSLDEMDSAKVASFLYVEPFITLIISLLLQREHSIVI